MKATDSLAFVAQTRGQAHPMEWQLREDDEHKETHRSGSSDA
jgi:hypothetical protein